MRRLLTTAARMTVVLTVLTGVIYPFAMTALAQVLFNHQANGSLITNTKGQVVGSEIIGQLFTRPQYFHGRASAAVSTTSPNGYAADASAGTQLAPTNTKLLTTTVALAAQTRKEDGLPPNYPLPADAVSSSASACGSPASLWGSGGTRPRWGRCRRTRCNSPSSSAARRCWWGPSPSCRRSRWGRLSSIG